MHIIAPREYQRLVQLFMVAQLDAAGVKSPGRLGSPEAFAATLGAVEAQSWEPPFPQVRC